MPRSYQAGTSLNNVFRGDTCIDMGIVSCMKRTDLGKVKTGYEIVFVDHYFFLHMRANAVVHVWRSEGNLQQSTLSFHPEGSKD